MTELKDNKLGFQGTIISSTNKMYKDEPVTELKVRVSANVLDGKRDALEGASHKPVLIELTPSDQELDLDGAGTKEAEGQTELIKGDKK